MPGMRAPMEARPGLGIQGQDWQLHTATVEGVVAACRRFVAENAEEEEEEDGEEDGEEGEEEEEAGEVVGEEEDEEEWQEEEEEEYQEEATEEWGEEGADDEVDPALLRSSNQEDDGQTNDDADWSADESESSRKRLKVGASQQEAAAVLQKETLMVDLSKALE